MSGQYEEGDKTFIHVQFKESSNILDSRLLILSLYHLVMLSVLQVRCQFSIFSLLRPVLRSITLKKRHYTQKWIFLHDKELCVSPLNLVCIKLFTWSKQTNKTVCLMLLSDAAFTVQVPPSFWNVALHTKKCKRRKRSFLGTFLICFPVSEAAQHRATSSPIKTRQSTENQRTEDRSCFTVWVLHLCRIHVVGT